MANSKVNTEETILRTPTDTPENADANSVRVYTDGTNVYSKDASGTIVNLSAGAGATLPDEKVGLMHLLYCYRGSSTPSSQSFSITDEDRLGLGNLSFNFLNYSETWTSGGLGSTSGLMAKFSVPCRIRDASQGTFQYLDDVEALFKVRTSQGSTLPPNFNSSTFDINHRIYSVNPWGESTVIVDHTETGVSATITGQAGSEFISLPIPHSNLPTPNSLPKETQQFAVEIRVYNNSLDIVTDSNTRLQFSGIKCFFKVS